MPSGKRDSCLFILKMQVSKERAAQVLSGCWPCDLTPSIPRSASDESWAAVNTHALLQANAEGSGRQGAPGRPSDREPTPPA